MRVLTCLPSGACVPTPASFRPVPSQRMMMNDPKLLHAILEHLTDSLITYAGYQIESGAQVRQPGSDALEHMWEGRGCLWGVWE